MIDRIPLKPTSIEWEIFPEMAKEGVIYSRVLDGFWMDIGQPKDFIKGTELYLKFLEEWKDEKLTHGENIIGNVVIHPTA